jgi:AmiR/NasT family two-component response regulator
MNTPVSAASEIENKRLILLVDDDIFILGLLSQFLQKAGFDTRMATSGQMALDMIQESGREPDLAVLDIAMPAMSGLELARRLQAETTIPVMFLTANEDDEVVKQATEDGALGYLVKPIDTARITPSIKAALARADEIRHLRQSESKLTAALQAGRETGIAIGLLMERYKTDRDSAFEVLRDYARSNRLKLNDVAKELLAAEEALNRLAGRFLEQVHHK